VSQAMRSRLGLPLWVALLMLALPQPSSALDPDQLSSPHPGLTPADVVRLQVEALGANDDRDQGIAVAFRFASPSNRQQTGPLSRFAEMIKGGPYRLMLGYDKAVYGPLEVVENAARQRVTLFGKREIRTFIFLLAKQPGEPCKNCWMTDAVIVEPTEAQTI